MRCNRLVHPLVPPSNEFLAYKKKLYFVLIYYFLEGTSQLSCLVEVVVTPFSVFCIGLPLVCQVAQCTPTFCLSVMALL